MSPLPTEPLLLLLLPIRRLRIITQREITLGVVNYLNVYVHV